MPMYIHVTKSLSSGAVLVGLPLENPTFQSDYSELLKTYELQEDGTLTEYVEPVRMFAGSPDNGRPGNAYPLKDFLNRDGTLSTAYPPIWELMPNGDYRKLSDSELEELRNA